MGTPNVEASDVKRESKRLNLSVIIFGIVVIMVGQTWLSVLTAQQAYSMNEARVNESRIERVSERLEELVNFFRSPELIYYYASNEGYNIVLTPYSEDDSNESIKTWSYSAELEVEEKYNEAVNFVDNINPLLPSREVVYFVPFRETVNGTIMGEVLTFFETASSFISQVYSEGFNITWESLQNSEEKLDVLEIEIEERQIVEAEIVEELLEETDKGLLPAPITH